MKTEYDENVLDYKKLSNGNINCKDEKIEGLDDDFDNKITSLAHLVAFISSNSKGIMKNFFRGVSAFYKNNVFYTDTDSLYKERKYWDVLNKAKLIGGDLCQGKNNYADDKLIFYGLYIAPKIKNVLTIDKSGILQKHKTLKGFNDSKRLLDRFQYFKKIEGKKISALLS